MRMLQLVSSGTTNADDDDDETPPAGSHADTLPDGTRRTCSFIMDGPFWIPMTVNRQLQFDIDAAKCRKDLSTQMVGIVA